jgi:tetratricopeptide (TPR) repeat protein
VGPADASRFPTRYLDGLDAVSRGALERVNARGIEMLIGHLRTGDAIAFAGAGASAPLYPLWGGVIEELVSCAAPDLTAEQAETCRMLAAAHPDAVVEIVRRELGAPRYREALRQVFAVRRDPGTGRTWTPTHELITRCNFKGVVTTNYDPGIVDARMAVRTGASSTGFVSYTDEDALDGWRTGDVFGGEDLPVLYAHGRHSQPEAIVLATTEYRRAYAGKLGRVLATLLDIGRVVWIGFSFADQRIAAILREVAEASGTRTEAGRAPRHVAIMPWGVPSVGEDAPTATSDPVTLSSLVEIQFGSQIVLYPVIDDDHAALQRLLAEATDPRFPPAKPPQERVARPAVIAGEADEADEHPRLVVKWVHGGEPLDHFKGRAEELARLSRWAGERDIRLVGVSAWGGSGKTSLVTEWIQRAGGAAGRRGVRGVFGWSFYENRSAEAWADELTTWAGEALGFACPPGAPADRVIALLRDAPLVIVLDGLEVLQEGPAGTDFGRLLDGTLRVVLTAACLADHGSLVVLTSRFPFADVEQFDGGAARMLDVPPLTPEEGAALLADAGGGWLRDADRRELVASLDGHALAVNALAGALAARPPTTEVDALRGALLEAGRTDERVARVLRFYAERLDDEGRELVALVSMFQRPVTPTAIVSVAAHKDESPIARWDAARVETAVRQRLVGLLAWHGDGSVSAHPLVRDAFRPFALTSESAQLAASVALGDLPEGGVRSRDEAMRVIEMIELLVEADEWGAADSLFIGRTEGGEAFKHLPAARLGQRCGMAFVGSEQRRRRCSERLSRARASFFANDVGLFAKNAGDLATAERFLSASNDSDRSRGDWRNVAVGLRNIAECRIAAGDVDGACIAAREALDIARRRGEKLEIRSATVHMAAALDLGGETRDADDYFLAAGALQIGLTDQYLYSLGGEWWGAFLVRTRRILAARRLIEAARAVGERWGWNEDIARCDSVLALCDLAEDDVSSAGRRLAAASRVFRDGDYHAEYADALPAFAEQRRRDGDLAEAEARCTEGVVLAGPRGLVPAHAAALAERAHVRGDAFTAHGDTATLERARDDADHALRLATSTRRLPWLELAGVAAHARLDDVAGTDRGWARRAETLRAVLIPTGLDPNPLETAASRSADDEEPAG